MRNKLTSKGFAYTWFCQT